MYRLNPRSTARRLWIFLFVFVTIPIFLNAQSADLAKVFKEFMRATNSGNTEQMVNLIHPEIIERYGGRERLLRDNEFKGLKLNELREVSEVFDLEGVSYASASYIGIAELDMSKAKGQGGMGMAISTMLMKLKAEQGAENVVFNEETYLITVKGVDANVVAIKDPRYSGWKIVPANGKKSEGIIPEKVKRHFESRLLYSLSDEISTAVEEFMRVIKQEGIEEESKWFLEESDYFIYKGEAGLKGLDAIYSFSALDTIYWAQEYEDRYVALLSFSGKMVIDPLFVEDHSFYFYNDKLIMLTTREKKEEDWKFIWERGGFSYLPSRLSPYEYFESLEKELEKKRQIQQWEDYNKAIMEIPAKPAWRVIEGSWSGWDNAGITTYTFNNDGTYRYYYVQKNGYDSKYPGTYEYLEEEALIRMRGYNGRVQYFKQLNDGTAIISPRREELQEDNVFNEGTNYILFRDGYGLGNEINDEVEAALIERQRMVVFNLMMNAGIPIQWTSIHSDSSSDKFFLEKLSCETVKEDMLFKVHFDTYAKHGLEWTHYVWEGSMADWDSNECVINMAMARKLAGGESEIEKLVGKNFPCNPKLKIKGILEPSDRYDQEVIPTSIPIVFSFE